MKWGKRLITLFFVLLVPILLYMLASNLDWGEVHASLRAYSPQTLLVGLALVACSYAVFSSYDLVGRAYTGHSLPARQVIPVALVCYAFNLSFTTWVGGVAMRYRLYTRLGLDTPTITRIMTKTSSNERNIARIGPLSRVYFALIKRVVRPAHSR